MALPKFGSGDAALFATKRVGREPTVIDPKTLANVTDLFVKHGLVQGQEYYTASVAETEAFNGKRETAAKTASKEIPAPITVAAMAERKARADGNTILPYARAAMENAVSAIVDGEETNPLFGRVPSLRTVDQGTADNPKVLWAIVPASPRVRESK
jgi:hypothetical protein